MKSKIKALIDIIKQIAYVLTKEQKRASVKSFIAILSASVFELLGVTMIVPFISAIMNADVLMGNSYIKKLMDFFGINSANGLIIGFGIILILVYILKNLLLLFSRYIQNRYIRTVEKELSMTMLKSYMRQPYEFFVNTNTAELMRGMGEDVSALVMIVTSLFSILAEVITMSFIIIFIFVSDWITAIALSVFAGGSILAIILGCKNIMRVYGEKNLIASTEKARVAYQLFGGIKDIYVMQRKENFVRKYDDASEECKNITLVNDFVKQIPERIIEVVVVAGIIIIVSVRILQGYDINMYLPKLSALAIASFRLLPSMNKLATGMTQIIFYQPGFTNIYSNIERARSCVDGNDNENNESRLSFNNKIEVKNINWKYQKGKGNILDNLSLEIKKGESIAVIGKSGEGKTTLGDSILGLFKPQKGTITVDGKDVYSNLKQWAKYIGYVPQSVYLLDDTIRANVLFGTTESNEEKVWEALRQAQLEDFVKNLPEGLDTIVGERGVKFSGGQRQRIAIARALYYDPEIIVFDEATSALDDGTEKAVMEAINSLQGTKTLIIIAHRLTTIKNCDKIYEIEKGRAIERTREEILD